LYSLPDVQDAAFFNRPGGEEVLKEVALEGRVFKRSRGLRRMRRGHRDAF
jgi:hypothetical protein